METTYAYLAGAIDADGFISIGQKVGARKRNDGTPVRYYVVKIGLSETDATIPDLLQSIFPSWRGSYQPKNPLHKRWYIWQATDLKARKPLVQLLPYLRLKHRQAELALSMLDLKIQQNTGRFMGNRLTPEQARARWEIYAQLTHLNAPRNRRVYLLETPVP